MLDTRGNQNGRYPLNWAAYANEVEIITILLTGGADINQANVTGFTPLHHAIEGQATEAALLLIEKGADLTLTNSRDVTVLQFAMRTGQATVFKAIRDALK